MRLATRPSRAAEPHVFDVAKTAAQLGYFTKLPGAHITVAPDAEYPWPVDLVHQIRAEFDADFVPAFIRQPWMTPAHTVVITGRHLACRHRPILAEDDADEVLHEAVFPCSSVGGMHLHGPVLASTTLEVRAELTDAEKELSESAGLDVRRELGGYVPFDGRVVETFRAIRHQNANKTVKQIKAEVVAIAVQKAAAAAAAIDTARRDELRDKWKYLERIREHETEADRKKALAPRERKPFAFLGRAS